MKKKSNVKRDIFEIIVAIIMALLFYYVLSLVTGTGMPIVSVVSNSMYHTDSFNKWWSEAGSFYKEFGIEKEEFLRYTNFNGLSVGDLLFVVNAEDINRGDIVIYQSNDQPITIVHRVVELDGNVILTKGDNYKTNPYTDKPVDRGRVRGKVIFAVPLLGYPRLLLHWVGI